MNTMPLSDKRDSLWWLAVGPGIWFAHFMVSYVTGAVWCAKFAPGGAFWSVRTAVLVYTLVALAGIIAVGWRGYRHHRFGKARLPHDENTPQDRHRFLGFATLLLCGLSFIATLYSALVVVFIGSCR